MSKPPQTVLLEVAHDDPVPHMVTYIYDLEAKPVDDTEAV